jgi:hypothetical protein
MPQSSLMDEWYCRPAVTADSAFHQVKIVIDIATQRESLRCNVAFSLRQR